jgi:hypothetical protein
MKRPRRQFGLSASVSGPSEPWAPPPLLDVGARRAGGRDQGRSAPPLDAGACLASPIPYVPVRGIARFVAGELGSVNNEMRKDELVDAIRKANRRESATGRG